MCAIALALALLLPKPTPPVGGPLPEAPGRAPPFVLTFPCRAARGATKARRPAPRLRRTPRQTPRRPAPQAAGHRGDSRAGVSWIFVCREAAFVSRTREGPQDGAARSAAGEGREADFGPAAGRAAPCGEAALPPSGLSCLRAERAWTNLEYPFLFNRNTLREFGRNSGRESTIIFHAGCDTWFTPPFSRTVRTFQEVSAPCALHFSLEWGRLAAALPASGDAPLAPGPCPRPRPAGGAGTPRPECAPPRFVATSARPVPRMAVGECGDALFRGGGCLIVRHFRPSD